MVKKSMDYIVAGLLLLMLWPVILGTALIVRIHFGAPILFRQVRPGLHGKPFEILKFRTMTNATDDEGQLLPDYIRLTGVGRFLRKLSLDELPQLFNVLKGELSLVGPRPLLMEYLPLYTEEQAKRHLVKPGITGWAQVHGRNAMTWEERLERDAWYAQHQCFRLDLKILWMTIGVVAKSKGISNDNHATMPVFQGKTTNLEG
ncbi:sugar transferase [Paenibacillus sp. GXUN7292]|uniref:sugar transferase n=1 Tax=Paenibacillus sp. GXUN7292 TaxID=3422499 RepID=UPI003D7ED344